VLLEADDKHIGRHGADIGAPANTSGAQELQHLAYF